MSRASLPSMEGPQRMREVDLIPLYKEIFVDTETPVSAFLKVGGGMSFLLESVEGGEKWGRYSFIGIHPRMVFRSRGRVAEIEECGRTTERVGDPLELLQGILKGFRPVEVEGLPRFYGGAVGYVSYDTVRFFERLPEVAERDIEIYDTFFIVPDTLLIFDNVSHKAKIVSNAYGRSRGARKEAEERIEAVIERLRAPLSTERKPPPARPHIFKSNMEKEEFLRAVRKAKGYIEGGDVVQVVLSQRFETDLDVDPFDIYRALRVINPSPYMFFLNLGDTCLIGSSPEILVRLERGMIVTRPIAGTRPRGRDEEEDRRFEEDLLKDPKEIAEHVMLVDLGRNDLGRVAEVGTVKVDEFMTVERYSHVMHIVSNVSGILREGEDAFSLLRACFPAGTLTGAPKVRAMEIIEELEPCRRGVYGGSVGYFGFSGNMDMCITIRTILVKDGRIYVQAGAGIVADSQPEREYEETVNKAKAMLKAVELARKGLWSS